MLTVRYGPERGRNTPSVCRLFSPEKAKTPVLGSLVKSPGKTLVPGKAPVPRKAAVRQVSKEQTTKLAIRKALGQGMTEGIGQAQHQEVEQAIQTRSGRISVKRVVFEAGKN
jgi:hypothetical protein